METDDMGRVVTEATIYNLHDLVDARFGKLPGERVRMITLTDALVDSGATSIGLPKSLIAQLGLITRFEKRARTASGVRMVDVYDAVRVDDRRQRMFS